MDNTSNSFLRSNFFEKQLSARASVTGVVLLISFVSFFLIMRLLGYEGMVWLRSLNGFYLAIGLALLLKRQANESNGELEFLDGMRLGLRATVIAIVPFAFFMFLVLSLNTEFLTVIQENASFGSFITPFSAAGMITVEGLVSGFMICYILMMRYKSN